jgi:hypothetical protein
MIKAENIQMPWPIMVTKNRAMTKNRRMSIVTPEGAANANNTSP